MALTIGLYLYTGREITLDEDILDIDLIHSILREIAEELEAAFKRKCLKCKTVTLKVKYFDFQLSTRSTTVNAPADTANIIMEEVLRLLKYTEAGNKKIRLLGYPRQISTAKRMNAEINSYCCSSSAVPPMNFFRVQPRNIPVFYFSW